MTYLATDDSRWMIIIYQSLFIYIKLQSVPTMKQCTAYRQVPSKCLEQFTTIFLSSDNQRSLLVNSLPSWWIVMQLLYPTPLYRTTTTHTVEHNEDKFVTKSGKLSCYCALRLPKTQVRLCLRAELAAPPILVHVQVPKSRWLSYHAGFQEVSRCYTGGVSEETIAGDKACK